MHEHIQRLLRPLSDAVAGHRGAVAGVPRDADAGAGWHGTGAVHRPGPVAWPMGNLGDRKSIGKPRKNGMFQGENEGFIGIVFLVFGILRFLDGISMDVFFQIIGIYRDLLG